MNAIIESLNRDAVSLRDFAWPMLWQSSLLVAVLFAGEWILRKKIRASVRYALWLVLLLKLLVPPTLALPTNPAWWIHPAAVPPPKIPTAAFVVTQEAVETTELPPLLSTVPPPLPPRPHLSRGAWLMLGSAAVSVALFSWFIMRWTRVVGKIRGATEVDAFSVVLDEARGSTGLRKKVRLRLTADSMSPAVCGLFRPVILLPRSLAGRLSREQLRAVLLHELIHLRRGDVWINCAQALLQIVYWWHPLLWLANARIRRVREEAVDDAVVVALREEAEIYAPTLLEVAKFAFRRPLASLGLVGILESRSALRQRIERLIDLPAPRKAGLTVASFVGILAFTAVAVPMGEGPARNGGPLTADVDGATERKSLTVKVDLDVFIKNVKALAPSVIDVSSNDWGDILLAILDMEGVNCSPTTGGSGIAIDTAKSELTKEGTPEELDVFQKVVEQLNRADGKPELPLRNTPIRRKSVLITARLYRMQNNDFDELVSGLRAYGSGDTAWWSVAPDKFDGLIDRMKSSGFKPISVPRIQTGHGMRADFYVGTPKKNVELDCQPFIRQVDGLDGAVDLAMQMKTVGQFTDDPAGDWPIMEGTNRYAIKNAVSALDHGGIVLRAINPASAVSNNLVVVLNVQIGTNNMLKQTQRAVPIIRREPGKNGAATAISNALSDPKFRAVLHALEQRNGAETLAEPEVVTTSGRQVQMMTADYVLQQPQYRNVAVTNALKASSATSSDPMETGTFHIQKPITQGELDELFRASGIKTPPTTTIYQADTGLLIARGTVDQLALVYGVVLRLNGISPTEKQFQDFAKDITTHYGQTAARAGGQDMRPGGTASAGSSRRQIVTTLHEITWDKPAYDRAPLTEVIRDLHEKVRTAKGNTKQINFLLDQPPAGGPDVKKITVTMKPPAEVRMDDLLDLIVSGADQPIKYSIQDFGVMFSWKDPQAPPPLEMRVFQVDKSVFSAASKSVGGGQNNDVSVMARDLFGRLGLDLTASGRSLAYNDGRGLLFVKATASELDTIERVIQAVSPARPQIHIKARFIEVPKEAVASATFFTNAVAGPMTGILSDSNFRAVLHALHQRPYIDTLAEPEVVTGTGYRTRMQATDIQNVITNFALEEDGLTNSIVAEAGEFEIGLSADIIPRVLADGNVIDLTVIPARLEFLGYDRPTNRPVAVAKDGQKVPLPGIAPRFRIQESTNHVALWDNQTLVLGNFGSAVTDSQGNAVAESKELAAAEKKKGRTGKQILVFITATLIDQAGNRVHSDKDLPFNPSSIPPQPQIAASSDSPRQRENK